MKIRLKQAKDELPQWWQTGGARFPKQSGPPCQWEVCRGNLSAIKQVPGWHYPNEFLDFSWLQHSGCFPHHAKVNNFLSEQACVSAVLTWWEMWEISDTSALPPRLTKEDHRALGTFLGDADKPVIVPAHNNEALTLPLLALQWGKLTELIPHIKITPGFRAQPGPLQQQPLHPEQRDTGTRKEAHGSLSLWLCYKPLHLSNCATNPCPSSLC